MNNGYAICYKEWILDRDIKNEIQLLLLISNLCAKLGYCYAGNKYFANMFDCTEVSISTKLRKLCEKNYIEINYTKRGCEIVERKIRLKNFLTDDLKKFEPTIKKDFKENNININNIKEKEKEKDDPKPPLPDGGQADFVSFEEQRKKDYELAELTKKKIQDDLIKKFGGREMRYDDKGIEDLWQRYCKAFEIFKDDRYRPSRSTFIRIFIAAAREMKYPIAGIARVVNRDHTTILHHQARITPAELLMALRFLDEPNFKAKIKD